MKHSNVIRAIIISQCLGVTAKIKKIITTISRLMMREVMVHGSLWYDSGFWKVGSIIFGPVVAHKLQESLRFFNAFHCINMYLQQNFYILVKSIQNSIL
jgi:hypothetical protein